MLKESMRDIFFIDKYKEFIIFVSAPYEEFTIADINSDVFEHYFNHDDEKHDYDFSIYENN